MKQVFAVSPCIYKNNCNFKLQPYNAWKSVGGKTSMAIYPYEPFKGIIFNIEFPSLWKSDKKAKLRFVEACSLSFDTFPDYAFYEIIPIVWDAWPQYDEIIIRWFKQHDVKTCIFTSSQAATRIRNLNPELNVLSITEGFNISLCEQGRNLREREIDVFLYGRVPKELHRIKDEGSIKTVISPPFDEFDYDLQHSKVTVAIAKEINGRETLTQRFWEGMLSRMIMVGRSPEELINLIGYDPVIPIQYDNFPNQVKNIVSHIEEYQELVDKNREIAMQFAPWTIRMKKIMDWLESLGYKVR